MLLSKEELEKMLDLHPEVADHMAKNPPPKMDFSDPTAMRKGMQMMEELAKSGPVPSSCSETYHEIPMRDGFMSSLKIQKPTNGLSGPLIVLIFGGGFVGGSNEQLTQVGRALVDATKATVVSINYRLAPEHKFPAAQNDTLDNLKWIADNANGPLLSSDPKKGFIVGGVSAGASLTAAFSRVFENEPLAHPLTGQWLCVPSVMDSDSVPEKYRDYYLAAAQLDKGPMFSKESREQLQRLVEADFTSPLRYAANSTTPISKQPRTYFQIDGMDPLRDDGLIYEEMLKEAGVETKIDVYPGCPHAHQQMLPGLDITNKTNIDTVVGFGWLLGTEVSREQAAKAFGM